MPKIKIEKKNCPFWKIIFKESNVLLFNNHCLIDDAKMNTTQKDKG